MQRGRQGYVRRRHGDLHLANIVLIERKPVLFDAIEFDPTIASIDVLYDLAFPIMDFIRYDRNTAANALLNRYLKTTSVDNLDALAALPLLMSLRVAIRANVLLARRDRNANGRAGVMPSTQTYFELARQLIDPTAPILVAVGGLSGTGKSVLAQALASGILPQPGAVVLRSDVLRKQQFGVNETDRLPEKAYQPEMTQKIYDVLVQHALRILSQGHSVVVDAVFAQESERAAIRNAAPAEYQVCRPISSDRSCDQAEPRRPARGRCIRRDARDCRTSGKIRYRQGRLGGHRCFRNAGANPETKPNSNHAL